MNPKLSLLALTLVSLSACAQMPAPSPQGTPLPGRFDEQSFYQVLLAEVAGQRGDPALAAEAYLDLARKTRDSRIARRGTEIAMFARQSGPAVQLAQLWVELQPDMLKARNTLVTLLLANGRLTEAKPHIQALLTQGDRPVAEAFQHLPALLRRHADRQEALDLIRSLATGYPDLPEASFAVAQVAWSADQTEVALRALDNAQRLKPGWDGAALFRGQILEKAGDVQAVTYWRDYLKSYPQSAEIRLSLAKILARMGDNAGARAEFEELRRRMPENPDTYMAIGLLAMRMEQWTDAENSFKQALERGYADEGQALLYLGRLAEERRQPEEALAWYGKVESGRHVLEARLHAAILLGKLGRLDAALALLDAQQPEREGERIDVIQTKAQLLRDARRYAEAFAVLGGGLEKLPDSPELLYDRAMVAEKLDRLDVLEADLRRLIVLRPDHAHAFNALGYTLADRTDRLAEAIRLLEQAMKLAPDDPFILDSMGWAQFKAGRLAEAEAYLRRAYAGRRDPEIAAHLGEVLWARGAREEARELWRKALTDDPENEVLRDTLARLRP